MTDKCKCPRCSYTTSHKPNYITHHLEAHMGLTDNIIPCRICGQQYRDTYYLTNHYYHSHFIKDKESKQLLVCDKCPGYFQNKFQLWRHELSRHGYVYCREVNCSEKFAGFEELREHIKLHGNFFCQFCEIAKEYAPDLSIHELEHNNSDDTRNSQIIKCPRCSFTCKEQGEVVTHHLEIHLKLSDKGFLCRICSKRFNSFNDGKLHYKQTHRKAKIRPTIKQCMHCLKSFVNHKELLNHRKTSHLDYTCSAENCTATFNSEKDLEDHKTWHGEFKCQFCNVCVSYAPDLAKHEIQLHGLQKSRNKTHKCCSRCSYSSTLKLRCVNHFMEVHLKIDSRIFRCLLCNYAASTAKNLRTHENSCAKINDRDSKEIHTCDQCSASFPMPIQLINHKRIAHQDGVNDLLYCKICKKSFKTRQLRQMHRKKYHELDENYKFVCSFPNCKRRFETQIELDRHKAYPVQTHVSETKKSNTIITCEKCGKQFKGNGSFQNHMRVHRDGRPTEFKCGQCDKVFNLKANLQRHEEYHKAPDQWKFICELCSKRCVSKQKLEEHTRTHTKEKPFCCQFCGENYAHRHNLRNHVKSKHKDEADVDTSTKSKMRFYVSRKGKKLGREFCFTRDQDNQNQN